MKIKAIFEVEISLTDENVAPTSDDVLEAMQGLDYSSIVCQPGVEDGWQVWLNNVEWSVVDDSAQLLEGSK